MRVSRLSDTCRYCKAEHPDAEHYMTCSKAPWNRQPGWAIASTKGGDAQ